TFIQKCTRKLLNVLRLLPLLLRYCCYALSSHKLCAHYTSSPSLLVYSPRIRNVQGMTEFSERAYFLWYAKHMYTCYGTIVDFGCWLGSTSIPLAMGLVENPRSRASLAKVHAYSDFVWKSYMDQTVKGTCLKVNFSLNKASLRSSINE